MAYASAAEGDYGSNGSVIHADASHAESISVPDAELLFRGEFRRAGPDLVLTGDDGRHHLIPGYFADEKHPALVAPNGASLSPDLVDLLAGSPTPGEYAQAQPAPPPDAIGKVEKVVGNVTVMRNGVAVSPHVGDAVYKSDVIQTGANSSVGIGFPDGTALNLVPNTRMALNDYSYDPNGTSNGALFSLVEGTFAFVAGKVAHTGNMMIATPVATMGIRGTAGWSGHEIPLISSNLGNVYGFALAHDPGVDTYGRYTLYAVDLNGNLILDQNGNPIVRDAVSDIGSLTLCTIDNCTHAAMTSTQATFGQGIMQGAYDAYNLISNPNPQSNPSPGSPENPLNFPQLLQYFQENGNTQLTSHGSFNGTNTSVTSTITFSTPPPLPIPSSIVKWTSSSPGTWETAPDWNVNATPTVRDTVEINVPSGVTSLPLTVTVDESESAGGLLVGAGVVLDIIGPNGSFIVSNATINNAGTIETTDGGTLIIDPGTFTNSGLLEANGATINLTDGILTNTGTIEVTDGGTLNIDPSNVTNTGTLEANGGELNLIDSTVANTGTVAATGTAGIIDLQSATISGGTVSTGSGDEIEATSGTSTISDATVNNVGTLEAIDGSTLTIDPSNITNTGTLEAANAGTLIIDSSINNSDGTIDVQYGSTVDIAGSVSGGNATIDGGKLIYGGSSSVYTGFQAIGFGMLVLDGTNASSQFTGTVSGFGNGDIIDLAGITYSSQTHLTYDARNDTLTVSDAFSGPSITIQLAGSYVASNFVLSKDVNGDAEVTFTAGEAHEAPTLWLGGSTATVSEDGRVTLPSITALPVDSDDRLTVTIAGLPTGATITDDGTIFSGSSITLTEAAVGTTFNLNDLTLNDGTNTESFTLTVTANNTTPGEAASSASQTIAVTVNDGAGPAGVAGSAINLALANPSAADGEPVAVTVTGVPSGWQLNEGTNLGNGTWTIETDDLSALTVLTTAGYAGAMVLSVSESWTNAAGSTGGVTIADNVEAYAPGAPIFALSANDTLTGAGGNNEFVFAQPIGNDTIYNFNVATDKIDLMGFANIASFSDTQPNIAEDSNGDAVITIGAGETITLHGINAASLTAADFVFNQTPVVENDGNMVVGDGAMLPLGGTINNTGTIALNSSGDATDLQIISDGITLQGGGQLTLSDSDANIIFATSPSTLTNVNNTISGTGQIGIGDGNLMLVNEAHGTIDADVAGGTLTLETGNAITNDGILEATNGGTLQIEDPVNGSGSAIITSGTLVFDAQSNMNVTFNNGTGTPTYGELVLDDPSSFSGQISGFSGTAPDTAHSDVIDLRGFNDATTTFSESGSNGNLVLTTTDGSNIATLVFDNFDGTLSFSSDGDGGTLVTDPPATAPANAEGAISIPGGSSTDTYSENVKEEGSSYVGTFSIEAPTKGDGGVSVAFEFSLGSDQINLAPEETLTQCYDVNVTDAQNPAANVSQTVLVSIGGPGNDNFVFQPGVGADTIVNFNPQQDAIELDNFANAQSVQELQSLIVTDAHGNAVIDLGHSDSITIPGVTASYLQAHGESLVHLH